MNPFPKPVSEAQVSQEQQLMQLLKTNPQLMQKYQQELTRLKMSSSSSTNFQPVTSDQYKQLLTKNQVEGRLDSQGGITIIPQKGMVVKFFDKRTNQKIFVNIVKHEAVDHPEEKLLIDFQNQPSLRIPMSMGKPRQDSDKSTTLKYIEGVACKVIDVVMNPLIVQTADQNEDVFMFMTQIIGNYLLEKHKITVDEQRVIKVNLKYKGTTVQLQRVRGRKAPKIEQLSQKKTPQQQQQQQKLLNSLSGQQPGRKIMVPEFIIYAEDDNGNREQYSLQMKGRAISLNIEFDMSHLIHSRGIHLQGSRTMLYLSVRGIYEICLRMPIQIGRYHAIFGKAERKLIVSCQGVKTEQTVEKTNDLEEKSVTTKPILNIDFQPDLLQQIV